MIKVEAPPNGDSVRYFGRTCGAPYLDNENPIHDLSNGGKECISLDLKREDDMAVFHRLLARGGYIYNQHADAGTEKARVDL